VSTILETPPAHLTATSDCGLLVAAAAPRQPDAALAFIANKFSLSDYETNAKNAILVDFYLWTLMFCKEHGLNEEKTSAVFTIGAAACIPPRACTLNDRRGTLVSNIVKSRPRARYRSLVLCCGACPHD